MIIDAIIYLYFDTSACISIPKDGIIYGSDLRMQTQTSTEIPSLAQSARAAECTDCISAEG